MNCDKTTNFLRERKRMCDAQKNCERCPLNDYCFGDILWVEGPKQAIEIVQKWSDEHPQKTYADDFLRSFRTQIEEPTKFRLYAVEVYMEANAIKGNNALIAGTNLWRNKHD